MHDINYEQKFYVQWQGSIYEVYLRHNNYAVLEVSEKTKQERVIISQVDNVLLPAAIRTLDMLSTYVTTLTKRIREEYLIKELVKEAIRHHEAELLNATPSYHAAAQAETRAA